jgi:hypothetical protein
MTVTRDVIEDLIPVYLAGEASADSRKLVEEYVAAHPEMRLSLELPSAAAEPSPDLGLRALEAARKVITRRNAWLGWAAGLSFAVFTFVFRRQEIVFLLYRDAPLAAYALLAGSAVCYALFYRTCRRLVVTGLGAPHSLPLWGGLAALASLPFTVVISAHTGWELVRGLAAPAGLSGIAMAKSLNSLGRRSSLS